MFFNHHIQLLLQLLLDSEGTLLLINKEKTKPFFIKRKRKKRSIDEKVKIIDIFIDFFTFLYLSLISDFNTFKAFKKFFDGGDIFI